MHRTSITPTKPRPIFLITHLPSALPVTAEQSDIGIGTSESVCSDIHYPLVSARKRKRPEPSGSRIKPVPPPLSAEALQDHRELALLASRLLHPGDWSLVSQDLACADPVALRHHFWDLMLSAFEFLAADELADCPRMNLLDFVRVLHCGLLVESAIRVSADATLSQSQDYICRLARQRDVTAARCLRALLWARDQAVSRLADRDVAQALAQRSDLPGLKTVYKKVAALYKEEYENMVPGTLVESLIATLLDKALGLPTPPISADFLTPAGSIRQPSAADTELRRSTVSGTTLSRGEEIPADYVGRPGPCQPSVLPPPRSDCGHIGRYTQCSQQKIFNFNSIMVGPGGVRPIKAEEQRRGVSDFTIVTAALRKMK